MNYRDVINQMQKKAKNMPSKPNMNVSADDISKQLANLRLIEGGKALLDAANAEYDLPNDPDVYKQNLIDRGMTGDQRRDMPNTLYGTNTQLSYTPWHKQPIEQQVEDIKNIRDKAVEKAFDIGESYGRFTGKAQNEGLYRLNWLTRFINWIRSLFNAKGKYMLKKEAYRGPITRHQLVKVASMLKYYR